MFESMSHEPSVRDRGVCPDCDMGIVRLVCEAGHSDCFSVECPDLSCGFWESNCYGGADNE